MWLHASSRLASRWTLSLFCSSVLFPPCSPLNHPLTRTTPCTLITTYAPHWNFITSNFAAWEASLKIHIPVLDVWLLLLVFLYIFFLPYHHHKNTTRDIKKNKRNTPQVCITSRRESTHVVHSTIFFLFMCKLGLRWAFIFFFSLIRVVRASPQRPKIGLAAPRHMAAAEWHQKVS